MKNHTTTNGIRIALFATFLLFSRLNLFAEQYKLDLEWQKPPGGLGAYISSITKSDNDSLIYVAFANTIRTIRTSDGETIKIDTVGSPYNLKMSKDGKTLAAASGSEVGLLDPLTFKRIYWDDTKSSDYLSLSLNEKQNKYVICGNSNLIRVYDINTKSIFKDLNPTYFENGTKTLKNVSITSDGKFVIYGYLSFIANPSQIKYYLKMIDLDGKVIQDFGETSSPNFTLTNDGNTLIYFTSDGIHFFDLITMKEKEGINFEGANPACIEMSNDGKFMLLGLAETPKIPASLLHCDLETKKSYFLRDFGTWRMFKLKKDNSNLFSGQSNDLYKWKFVPNTSVQEVENKLVWSIQIMGNNLILNSQKEILPTYNFNIVSLDGKTLKQILPNDLQINTNSAQINISTLKSGMYLFQISNNSQILFSSKFNKIN